MDLSSGSMQSNACQMATAIATINGGFVPVNMHDDWTLNGDIGKC